MCLRMYIRTLCACTYVSTYLEGTQPSNYGSRESVRRGVYLAYGYEKKEEFRGLVGSGMKRREFFRERGFWRNAA